MSRKLTLATATGVALMSIGALAACVPLDELSASLDYDSAAEEVLLPSGASTVPAPVSSDEAAQLLAGVPNGEPGNVHYERDLFGSGWRDTNQSGCDARNETLARDLTDVTFEPGTDECVVLTGHLNDPYTGTSIMFERGQDTSSLVQIDHVVPLSWAFQQGASSWAEEQRVQFANDPLNLLAVDGSSNMSKGDSGPSEWLPEAAGSHCGYASRFVVILAEHDLPVPSADRTALTDILDSCTGEGADS